MSSEIEDAIRSAIPSLFRVFGERQATVHTNSDADDVETTVILEAGLIPAGEYGERMEHRTTIETNSLDGAQVGDTWSIAQLPTADDPDPDPAIWRAEQILADDGMTRKFSVRRIE